MKRKHELYPVAERPSTSSNSRLISTSDWKDLRDDELSKDIDGLYVPSDLSGKRFYGKASLRGLFERIYLYTKLDSKALLKGKRPEIWVDDWNRELSTMRDADDASVLTEDVELVDCLVGIYFELVNITLPLLNEASFKLNLHTRKRERPFRNVLLLVCALGALFSDDERVLVTDRRDLRFLAGYRFYNEARVNMLIPDYMLSNSCTLENIQALILLQIYIQKGVQTKNTWMIHGLTVLIVQNQGLHLSWLNANKDTQEVEHGKRAIWMLYILDRAHTSCFGRPLLLKDEEMYLDLPAPFAHETPRSKLSLIFIREYLKLCKIHGQVIQELYKYRRSNSGEDLTLTITVIAALNAKLHKWTNEVHPTLSIDGDERVTDDMVYQLRCTLGVAYNNIQIFMHKPFMPYPNSNSAPSGFQVKSLMICANAARSIIISFKGILLEEVAYRWNDCMFDWSPFSATLILILNCCESRRNGEFYQSDLDYIKSGVLILRSEERRNQLFARAVDILIQVLKASNLLVNEDFLDRQEALVSVLICLREDEILKQLQSFGQLADYGSTVNDRAFADISDVEQSLGAQNDKIVNDMLEYMDNPPPYDSNMGIGTNDFSFNPLYTNIASQDWSSVMNSILSGGTGET